MDDVVVDMHTKSGCSPRSGSSTITLEEAGARTLAFIEEHAPEPGTVPLCGNSIGTDRRFLAAYLPDIENCLHYRSVDVSSVKELVRRWYPQRAGRPARRSRAPTAPSTTSARASRSCGSTATGVRRGPAAGGHRPIA